MSYHLRHRSLGRLRGLGYVSPVGFPDFASFQTAAIASFPPCPPPFDPVCETPRDAQISANLNEWKTNPQSCGVIVCDANGQPVQTSPLINVTPISSNAPPPALNLVSPVFHPTGTSRSGTAPTGTTVSAPAPLSPRPIYRPVPFSSASPSTAPGGAAAPPTSPTPVSTQSVPITLASDCSATQSYVAPGQAYQYPPYAGQIAADGACENIPAGTATSATSFLSSIPIWGWGLAGLGVILLTRGGKR